MAPEELAGWFAGRVPDGWFSGVPEVRSDHDEVLVVGPLSEPEVADDASDTTREAARAGRIKQFREETRASRMQIAEEAEHRFGRKVSWGASCGDRREVFTTLSVPVMTRLRLAQREVLDTLVAAGVARSRSDALGWCVRLVGQHQQEWIGELRDALVHVREVAGRGPATS